MRAVNYDKFPSTRIDGYVLRGWDAIRAKLAESLRQHVLVVDLYSGVHEEEVANELQKLSPNLFIDTRDLMKTEQEIMEMTARYMTDDPLFGYMTNFTLTEYFDRDKLREVKRKVEAAKGSVIIMGTGAHLVAPSDAILVYADMARWEIQQRFRRHEVKAVGVDNHADAPSLQYKRGYFNDWKMLDRYKDSLYGIVDYWLDTHISNDPKLIDRSTFMEGIDKTVRSPFRVVPFFDPAPWGGQWMKKVCGLDEKMANFGWCFDCVPEENSLYLDVRGIRFEMPSINVVLLRSRQLLGEPVEARFGKEFPIRFDFLDTVGGGNLSLQVHPTTEFVHQNFGIHYTQDESYYLLDCEPGATVFLGLKEDIHPEDMINDLRKAQRGEIVFDAEKYVNRWPAKKHDHFLIPGGTVHCSGAGSLVLEISSTPSLFTFKLWDWQRLGLDGKPRPINVERGSHVIDFGRDTTYARNHLINQVETVAEGNGWREERTGLHPNEFIETRRHWFKVPVVHHTGDSVNVLNLVEGEEAIVESPEGRFEPFIVHYAETFIIPAGIGTYTIRPYGASEGQLCGTIKAYVRH